MVKQTGITKSTFYFPDLVVFDSWRLGVLDLLAAALVVSLLSTDAKAQTPTVFGIAHIAFRASNLGNSREFHEKTLRFEMPFSLSGQGGLAVFKVNDEQYIEVVQGDARSQGQLDHFAVYTDSLAQMRNYLLAKRVSVIHDIHEGRVGNPFFTISDPDGHQVEIVQYSETSLTGQSKGKFIPPVRISNHISHVGLLVRSESSAMKFYRDILGFREIARTSGENGQPGRIDLQVPDGTDYIELIPFADLPSPSVMKAQNHLGLAVPDVQKAVAILQQRPPSGAESIPTKIETGGHLPRRANLFDPDGARIELMEPLPAKIGGNGTPAHP